MAIRHCFNWIPVSDVANVVTKIATCAAVVFQKMPRGCIAYKLVSGNFQKLRKFQNTTRIPFHAFSY